MKARVWRAPAILALLSGAALVAGLLGDGLWDVMASLGLLLPLLAAWWSGRRGVRTS
ncbi:hypothetical protein [Roseicella sp. DB1501]|uniref:hypothetical protein n=1 Tax=Roseicella sp. DB1501 TaxID=2730925 RepID=UPI0014909761|nr:hypothetical protein [Roseicella sp. DB1501]NOG70864.1 hypothetical protein [Roseicella sp. DB1501]